MKNPFRTQTKLKIILLFATVVVVMGFYGLDNDVIETVGGLLIGLAILFVSGNVSASWVHGRTMLPPGGYYNPVEDPGLPPQGDR